MTSPVITVLPGTALPSYISRHPHLGWRNLFRDGVPVGSSEQAGYEAINIGDGKDYTSWRATSIGVHTLTVTFSTPQLVDYVAFRKINLAGGFVKLQADANADGTWVDLTAEIYSLETVRPYWFDTALTSARAYRLYFSSPGIVELYLCNIGKATVMERGCWGGSTPPWMGRNVMARTTKSENGVQLGRSLRDYGVQFNMDFEWLSHAFVRSDWMPFLKSTEVWPFFVRWNPTEYPGEVAFAWVDDPVGDIDYPKFQSGKFMRTGIQCKGRVE